MLEDLFCSFSCGKNLNYRYGFTIIFLCVLDLFSGMGHEVL